MNVWKRTLGSLLLALPVAFAAQAQASGGHSAFEVTITNITKGEIFTPIIVATHRKGMKLFEAGSPASHELEVIAESGNNVPLGDKLMAGGALDVVTTGGDVLPPGHSVTLTVKTDRHNSHVSLASMLVPTNDAFLALNGVKGPKMNRTKSFTSPAYDAGTEENDEMCANIPGPPFICAGIGFVEGGGEGYVYIHPGIHGIADLVATDVDWNNPVAKITIKKIRTED